MSKYPQSLPFSGTNCYYVTRENNILTLLLTQHNLSHGSVSEKMEEIKLWLALLHQKRTEHKACIKELKKYNG